MRTLAVIFSQPALCDFPCFIQRPEQIKIQYFCPVRPVESFDKGILCWLAGPEKFQHHTMLFCPLCQRQQDQLRTVIHPHLQRISAVCHDPAQHSDNPLRRDIQVNFDRQRFPVKSSTTLKVRKRLPHTSASCIKSMDQLWFIASGVASGAVLRTGRCCFPLRRKFSFSRK